MAHFATQKLLAPLAPIAAVGSAISHWFGQVMQVKSRAEDLERLSAMSDRQLADIGLRREDIVEHVFRDMKFL